MRLFGVVVCTYRITVSAESACRGTQRHTLDLISQVVTFLTNPHEQQTARNDYSALVMESGETFWEFYHEFRTLAKKGGVNDRSTLKMDLQDKILSRLRRRLFHEYRKSRTLEEYVEAIQAEDQGQIAEQTLYRNQPLNPTNRSTSSSSRRAVKNQRREKTSAGPSRPQQEHRNESPVPWKSQSPAPRNESWRNKSPALQPSARADIPRASTPGNAPRHFSSQPYRQSSSRINEIEYNSDDGSELGDVEDNDDATAALPAKEPTPRAKDQA